MLNDETAARAVVTGNAIVGTAVAFVGVDHKSLLFGFVGAFFAFAMSRTKNVTRLRAVILIITSAFIGAVCGLALTGGGQPPSAMSLLLSASAGAAPAAILSALAESIARGAKLLGIFGAKGGE